MARWKLMQSHYLKVPVLPDGTDVEWVHEETNRTSGRTVRKRHEVGMLLDTNNPADYNDPDGIIVCHEGKGEAKDYVFIGEPTPDMEPLDDEAETISAAMRPRWEHPIDTLPAQGGMNDKEKAFMDSMMRAFAGATAPTQPIPNAEIEALKQQVADLTKLMQTTPPEPKGRRL